MKDESANMMKLTSSILDNTLYFTTLNEIPGKLRWIYTYNLSSGKQDSISIKSTKETKQLFEKRLFSMEVMEHTIVLMNDIYVYVFNLNRGKAKFEYSLKLEKKFNQVFKLNDTELLLYVNYNFHPKSSVEKHVWAKLDLKSRTISPFKRMEESNNRFSSLNNRWISVYNGLIAHAQTTDYKISLYDSNFNLKDSIISDKLESNKKALSRLNPVYDYSRDEVMRDMRMDDSSLTRIQKIFLLDSTHLMVMLKLPKTFKCEFDLWEKNANGWSIKKTERLSGFYEESQKYTPDQQPVLGLFGNISGISYNNHEFYFVYYPFMENIKSESFNRKKDYDEPSNDLVRKGELYYGIYKYKVLVD